MYARPPPALIMWVWVCTPLYGGSGRSAGKARTYDDNVNAALVGGRNQGNLGLVRRPFIG